MRRLQPDGRSVALRRHGGADLRSKGRIDAPLISKRALNRALLARQLLLARAPIGALQAIEQLAGMQSQAPNPPYIGLLARVQDFKHNDLASLIVERLAVRVALMRSTIHLVSTADALAWRPVIQPVIDRMYESTYGRHLVGIDRDELHAYGRALLNERPLSFEELGKALAERWPDRDSRALANAIRTSCTLVQAPPRGLWGQSGQAKHVPIERWTGATIAPEANAASMTLRYLAAFGPASVRDLQTWSGLTKLRSVVDLLRSELQCFVDTNGRELFDLPDAPHPDEATPAPIRFLPEWDNVLLSYADPSRIIAPEDRKRVMSVNGIVSATVLVDGFVRATWSLKRHPATAELIVKPLGPIDVASLRDVEREGYNLLTFAADGLDHRVTIESDGFSGHGSL